MGRSLLNYDNIKKCMNKYCGNIIDEKQLQTEKEKYIKKAGKTCKNKNPKKNVKCVMKLMKKSKFYKIAEKRNKCTRKKCKKELKDFNNNLKKSMKQMKNSLKKKSKKKN